MSVFRGVKSAARLVGQMGPVLAVRRHLYDRAFERTDGWKNLHRGLYHSFAEARAAAPAAATYALDDGWYAEMATTLGSHDYPVLFWLGQLLPQAPAVLDLGGHVGVHFYAYARYLSFPDELRWTVCELPQVVARGEAMKLVREARQLGFVTDLSQAAPAPILLAAGCLQFLETPPATLLAGLAHQPRHLLLNKLPLHDRPTRVTLQNTGTSFSPCWLWNRDEFLADLAALGYTLVDEWTCPERSLHVPFHADHAIEAFRGMYLRMRGESS